MKKRIGYLIILVSCLFLSVKIYSQGTNTLFLQRSTNTAFLSSAQLKHQPKTLQNPQLHLDMYKQPVGPGLRNTGIAFTVCGIASVVTGIALISTDNTKIDHSRNGTANPKLSNQRKIGQLCIVMGPFSILSGSLMWLFGQIRLNHSTLKDSNTEVN